MEIYRTEQEQIDELKKLWQQYGKPIIVGVILALGLTYGWRYWQNQQENYREQASIIYLQLLGNLAANNGEATEQAKRLMTNYVRTPYAVLAAQLLAKQAVNEGNLVEAQTQLKWAMDHTHDPALKQLAALRAARVYIAQNQPQQALDLLAKQKTDIYTGLAEEVRGDALLVLKKPQEARQAYAQALKLLPVAENTRPILEMKYDAIPENNA